ncbi:right-handed parallel beta-helix repeat-containing protein [Verrucomicrobiales bacterium]|nr:right-handed parallel beta-helix repeat-containing protein [Verrucomicrobiales bacterium]
MFALFSTKSFFVLGFYLVGLTSLFARTIRVDSDRLDPTQDGRTWETAYTHLQDALSVAEEDDEIWVAEGIYFADRGSMVDRGDRQASFTISKAVQLLGGFAGNETDPTLRDHRKYPTILEGDLEENDAASESGVQIDDLTRRDNSVRIVRVTSANAPRIDGFIIRNGFSRTEPWVILYEETPGAGMRCENSSPLVVNCRFRNNYASSGGAVSVSEGAPDFVHCEFIGNVAGFGGAVSAAGASDMQSKFYGCVFSGNHARFSGGALTLNGNGSAESGGVIDGCTFSGNFSSAGSVIRIYNRDRTDIRSSIFWGNNENPADEHFIESGEFDGCEITHSIVETRRDGSPGWAFNDAAVEASNLSIDPMFLDDANSGDTPNFAGDLRIDSASPLVSISSDILPPQDIADIDYDGDTDERLPFDIIGKSRGEGSHGILGAFITEGPEVIAPPGILDRVASSDAQVLPIDLNSIFDNSSVAFLLEELEGSAEIEITEVIDGTFNIEFAPGAIGRKSLLVSATDASGATAFHRLETRVMPDGIRVDAGATLEGANGISWATAFPALQDAIAIAPAGSEIWVASGTYYPDEESGVRSGLKEATFELKREVAVYGGFSGDEAQRSDRRPAENPTVLSGDIGRDDTTDSRGIVTDYLNIVGEENSMSVVTSSSDGEGVRMDGFVITAGLATDGSALTIPESNGAGLYISGGNPSIVNCRFIGNQASQGGAAIQIGTGAFPIVESCYFTRNRGGSRGTVYCHRNSVAIISNSVFFDNPGGDALRIEQSPSTLVTHCTFSANQSAGIRTSSNGATIKNSIIWNNGYREDGVTMLDSINSWQSSVDISNSIVEGSGGSGENWTDTGDRDRGGNLDVDPLFASEIDLRLTANSPAIGTGLNRSVLQDFTDKDGDGNAVELIPSDNLGSRRIIGAFVDIGAFEYAGSSLDSDADGLPDDFEIRYSGTGSPTALTPDDDRDGDGMSILFEFAIGADPDFKNSQVGIETAPSPDGHFHFSYRRNSSAAPFVQLLPAASASLGSDASWESSEIEIISAASDTENPEIDVIHARSVNPMATVPRAFFRLVVEEPAE